MTHHRSEWSVVIAAAGRGTRLGFDKPKILFPVGGSTILDRLIALFRPLCEEFVFVLSPEGAPVIEPCLTRVPAQIAIQRRPVGMADAVACGAEVVRTANVVVVWGDQFALKPASLEFCMRLLEDDSDLEAVCPTLVRERPYIHFARDGNGRISTVLQQREGDDLPETGESDSGVFFFRTEALRRLLPELLKGEFAIGSRTRERNFLPIFPLLDRKPGALATPRIMTEIESIGVNNREDAAFLEAHANL